MKWSDWDRTPPGRALTATDPEIAALMRKESRGGHYRSDFPRAQSKWRRHIEL